MASLLFANHKLFLHYSLLLAMIIILKNIQPNKAQRAVNQTNLVFFLQDIASNGPNATIVPVTGVTGKAWSFSTFGTIFAVDDLVTETPDKRSAKLGRAQGTLVVSALDASNVSLLMSIVFENWQYKGSTLELQGVLRQSERFREVSVVSGTGTLRFAKGYAVFETIYYERETSYTIIRCTITLIHQ